jgi:hypothetical protein
MDLHGVDPKIWWLWLLSPFIVSAAIWLGVAVSALVAHTVTVLAKILRAYARSSHLR